MQEKKNQKDLKELAVFEMLEDAANDSSFCSTSSRVKTLMNHSILPSPQVPRKLLLKKGGKGLTLQFQGKTRFTSSTPAPAAKGSSSQMSTPGTGDPTHSTPLDRHSNRQEEPSSTDPSLGESLMEDIRNFLKTKQPAPVKEEHLASDGEEKKGRGRRGRATPATTPKTDSSNKTQASKTGKVAKEVKDNVDESNQSEVENENDNKMTRRGKLSSEKAGSPGPMKRKGGETSKEGKKSGSVVAKIMEGTEARKSGRSSASRTRAGNVVENDSKKATSKPGQKTKKSAESLPKIDSYFAKAPEKNQNSKANIGENPRKRKSEDDDSEDPTPAKKATQQLLQKSKKTPPKKSLAHRDILNLLDDFNDDDKDEDKNSDEETEVSFKTDTSVTTSKSWISSVPGMHFLEVQDHFCIKVKSTTFVAMMYFGV